MLYYMTSNKRKVEVAQQHLAPLDVEVVGKDIDLVEIQSENIEEIAKLKAEQAFKLVKKPLFVNDAGWFITALNGFPGAYMKHINDWLTADQILRMMEGQTDREVIFNEVICYIDASRTKVFNREVRGVVLTKNTSDTAPPSAAIVSLSSTGKSIAECWEAGIQSVDDVQIWHDFAEWYKSQL